MTAVPDVALVPDALPDPLKPALPDLVRALTVADLGLWPDGEQFHDADQARAIGNILIDRIHQHLRNADIKYLYRESIERAGETKLATMQKASAKLHYLTELDLLMEVNWTTWQELTGPQRVALIDHELCHCGHDGETFVLLPHDVEEFGAIVRRWGLWRPNLYEFAQAFKQLELFQS